MWWNMPMGAPLNLWSMYSPGCFLAMWNNVYNPNRHRLVSMDASAAEPLKWNVIYSFFPKERNVSDKSVVIFIKSTENVLKSLYVGKYWAQKLAREYLSTRRCGWRAICAKGIRRVVGGSGALLAGNGPAVREPPKIPDGVHTTACR